MVEGHTTENDGKLWKLTLRDGLKFHDGEPVLARDCVASIQRWGKRDAFGQTLLAVTDELSAPDDKTIQFRLKQPFPLLPDALGKPRRNFCAIMPERLAKTDAVQAGHRDGRQRAVPLHGGRARRRLARGLRALRRLRAARRTARPTAPPARRSCNFDRVEWHVIPDASTAAGAMQAGEIDWWENPTTDLLPLLRKAQASTVAITDPTGLIASMRFNQLYPPFDNPAIRRALLGAVNQSDYMIAVAGDDPAMWHDRAGVFTPGTPMASDAGMEVLTGPRDYDEVKQRTRGRRLQGREGRAAGADRLPDRSRRMADVGADMLQKVGMNVDYQAMDWGTVVQRRAKKDPLDKGGWSIFHTSWAGIDHAQPGRPRVPARQRQGSLDRLADRAEDRGAAQRMVRGAGPRGAEEARGARCSCRRSIDVPYMPLGQMFSPTSFRERRQRACSTASRSSGT